MQGISGYMVCKELLREDGLVTWSETRDIVLPNYFNRAFRRTTRIAYDIHRDVWTLEGLLPRRWIHAFDARAGIAKKGGMEFRLPYPDVRVCVTRFQGPENNLLLDWVSSEGMETL